MKKLFYYLRKIALWIFTIYVGLCVWVVLNEMISNIGVKKSFNGVTFSDNHQNVFKSEGFEPPWKDLKPTENWQSPPDWAIKEK